MTPAFDLAACSATDWQATPDMALRITVAAGLMVLGGWAATRQRFAGRGAFVVLTAVMAAWIGASVAEHAAVEADCKATIALASWLPIMAQAPALLIFLQRYAGASGPSTPTLALLLPSALFVALAWSNGAHGLLYGQATALGAPREGLPRLEYDRQPLFLAAMLLNYGWLLAALAFVLRRGREARGRHRQRWALFLAMMALPVAANLAYVLGGWRLLGVDPTSTAFAAALAGFAWLVHRDGLFSVVPLARERLFAELPAPVIVLDAEGRVADANAAALRLQPPPPPGRALADWPRFGPAIAARLGEAEGAAPGSLGVLELAGPPAWYELQSRPLGRAPRLLGTLLQLHDVGVRHLAHAEAVRTLAARELALDKATALQALLREQAMHDPLTGLLNRRALEERHAQERAGRTRPLALVVLDVDHFKQINDGHGHLVGDAVLRDVAAALRSGVRAGDALFRIGGEEFALLMPGADAAAAARRVQALRELLDRWQPGGLTQPVTFSAGVADAGPARDTLDALLAAADAALYAAKRGGRDRTEVAPPA